MTDSEAYEEETDGLPLWGLDGTSPLGFLATLGVLHLLTAESRHHDVTLTGRASPPHCRVQASRCHPVLVKCEGLMESDALRS